MSTLFMPSFTHMLEYIIIAGMLYSGNESRSKGDSEVSEILTETPFEISGNHLNISGERIQLKISQMKVVPCS